MAITIRRAEVRDIDVMSQVLIASITQLCAADHGNDPQTIADWTANKSPAGIAAMLQVPGSELYVAQRDGRVVAVGALAGDTITLNYVDPHHRRTGVSRTLLAALQAILVERQVPVAHLKSTATARAFYLSQGWVEDAPVPKGRFIQAFPMHKALIV